MKYILEKNKCEKEISDLKNEIASNALQSVDGSVQLKSQLRLA